MSLVVMFVGTYQSHYDLPHSPEASPSLSLSLSVEAGAQCRHLQMMLDEKNAAVARLTERLMNLDVDVAILVADRGR